MPLFRSLFSSALLLAGAALSASAQESPALGGQLHIDLVPLGASVGAASRVSPRVALGASLGVGGNWYNYMALGGRHFAEENGLSYQDKDGAWWDFAMWDFHKPYGTAYSIMTLLRCE